MSWLAHAWAESAPIADVQEFAILTVMAQRANSDGTDAHQSTPTIARAIKCDERTVARRLDALCARGVISLGDQSIVAHIRADRRPKVYDLMIPYSWYSAHQMTQVNLDRADRGLQPLTPEARPPLDTPSPSRKVRADRGKPRPRKDRGVSHEASTSHPAKEGQEEAAVPGTNDGVSSSPPDGVSSSHPIQSFKSSSYPEDPSLRSGSSGLPRSSSHPDCDLFGNHADEDHATDGGPGGEDQAQRADDRHLPPDEETPSEITARDVVAKWVDVYREAFGEEPIRQRVGQVAREAKEMLAAGRDPRKVMYAAKSAAIGGYPSVATEYDKLVKQHQGRHESRTSGPRQSATGVAMSEVSASIAAVYGTPHYASSERLGLPRGSQ